MYKICQIIDGKYYSFTIYHRAEYKIGEKTYPKLEGSKLFLFSNLEDAFSFKNINSFIRRSNFVIFRCEAENCEQDYPIELSITFENEEDMISDYWSSHKMHIPFRRYLKKSIKGCLTASSITLLEIVPNL